MTSDAELEAMRHELAMLRKAMNVDAAQRATRIRERIAALETEARHAREELFLVLRPGGMRGLKEAEHQRLAVEHDDAVTGLVRALGAVKDKINDSNVLLAMQLLSNLRERLGLSPERT